MGAFWNSWQLWQKLTFVGRTILPFEITLAD